MIASRRRTLVGAFARLLPVTVIIGISLLYASWLTAAPHPLFDFQGGLYNAGLAILHGQDPYRASFLAHQAAIMRAGGIAVGEQINNVFSVPLYPAPANVLVVPLSLLPVWLAGAIFTVASIAATFLALRLLGVRDRRCQLLVLVSWPSLLSLFLGAMGPFLLLGVAASWRWRTRLWPPAIAVASVVAAKLFPWTLALWLLFTRRRRAFALTIGIGLGAALAAWALIGFAGFAQYPQMLSDATFIQEGRASSLVALLLAAGCSVTVAHALALLAAGALLALAARFAHGWSRGTRPDGDRRAFGLVVLAALTASPIVWEHYMILLFVPIALASPSFSRLWLLPLCTPLALLLSQTLAAAAPAGGTAHPLAARNAAIWLTVEAIIGCRLCGAPPVWRLIRRRGPAAEPAPTPA